MSQNRKLHRTLPNFGEQIEVARPPSAEAAEEPKTTEGMSAGGSAQDVSFPYPDRHPPAVPEPPVSPPPGGRPRATPRIRLRGSGEGRRTFSGPLQHSESDLLAAKVEGGDYRTRSSDTTPETA